MRASTTVEDMRGILRTRPRWRALRQRSTQLEAETAAARYLDWVGGLLQGDRVGGQQRALDQRRAEIAAIAGLGAPLLGFAIGGADGLAGEVLSRAQLTQLIVRQYGFSADEAEAKKRSGELPEDYRQAVLDPFVDTLAQEVSRALQFFFTSTPFNKVDHILLAGGSAALAGLTEAVTQQTSFNCMVINPFDTMEMGSSVQARKISREAPAYLTSTGLALRRFHQ